MRSLGLFLSICIFICCTDFKEVSYTGSTPAGTVVKNFFGIPLADSVDFIRWQLKFSGDKYSLKCNYGIGKPSTSGFMEGGKHVSLDGGFRREKNYFILLNGDKQLRLMELNSHLLHVADGENHLLPGTGGWGYTLNSEPPALTDELNNPVTSTSLKDSMNFIGRTPCLPFPFREQSPNCQKLKWSIILYADPKSNQPTSYKLNAGANRPPAQVGTWSVVKGKDGRVVYRLKSPANDILDLVKLDENVVIIADKQGNLLVGDKDFSYSLSRKQ